MSEREEAVERARTEWLAAYAAANPTNEPPSLAYERGWFVMRYARNGGFPQRFRRAELEHMAMMLRSRAASPNPLSRKGPDHD